MPAFIPSYIIQDTIGLFTGDDDMPETHIEIYKPSNYGEEAIPNHLRIVKSQPLNIGLAINAIVNLTEMKFREIIEAWNTEIELRETEINFSRTEEYFERLFTISCYITNEEVGKWVEEYMEADHSIADSRRMSSSVIKALTINGSIIKDILFVLGYFTRAGHSPDSFQVEYEYSHIRKELDYYNGIEGDKDSLSAASLTTDKIKNYKKGLCNVFSLYIEFIQHLVNENYDKELPDDIWNKYTIIRDNEFRSFVKHKLSGITFVDTWYYTERSEANLFEDNQKYLEEVRNSNHHAKKEEILSQFSSNFGATVLIDIAIGTRQRSNHSYKSFIEKNWEIFRLECLRKGISVRKNFTNQGLREFFLMDKLIMDGSQRFTYNYSMYIGFRLKASKNDKKLCRKFGFTFEPMQLSSANSINKELNEVKKNKHETITYSGDVPIVVVSGKITEYENPKENVFYLNKEDENKELVLYIYDAGKWTRIYGLNPNDRDTSIAIHNNEPNEGNECVGSEVKPMTPEIMALLRDVEGEKRGGNPGEATAELEALLSKESTDETPPIEKGVSLNKEDYGL